MIANKTLAKIAAHPRVAEAYYEDGHGYWAHLKTGWCERSNDGCHTLRCDRASDLLREIRRMTDPCQCDECKKFSTKEVL